MADIQALIQQMMTNPSALTQAVGPSLKGFAEQLKNNLGQVMQQGPQVTPAAQMMPQTPLPGVRGVPQNAEFNPAPGGAGVGIAAFGKILQNQQNATIADELRQFEDAKLQRQMERDLILAEEKARRDNESPLQQAQIRQMDSASAAHDSSTKINQEKWDFEQKKYEQTLHQQAANKAAAGAKTEQEKIKQQEASAIIGGLSAESNNLSPEERDAAIAKKLENLTATRPDLMPFIHKHVGMVGEIRKTMGNGPKADKEDRGNTLNELTNTLKTVQDSASIDPATGNSVYDETQSEIIKGTLENINGLLKRGKIKTDVSINKMGGSPAAAPAASSSALDILKRRATPVKK